MVVFPNSKINIGLSILNKRKDGYHNLESIFYPIPLFDSLEFIESSEMKFNCSIGINAEKPNSVMKAYTLLKKDFDLPPISIYLQKRIPMGAGLGGGSSNGAFMLVGLNNNFKLGLTTNELEKYALKIGSDCPFFVENTTKLVSGVGEVMENTSVHLNGKYIVLVNPNIHISTQKAFQDFTLKTIPNASLKEVMKNHPISSWKNLVFNDFEQCIFSQYPEIEKIKVKLYKLGAKYASMTGTGSTIYGIFDEEPELKNSFNSYFTFASKL